MNRNGRHAGAALDTEMRAFLPDLQAPLRSEDPPEIFGFHLPLVSIGPIARICLAH